LFLQLVVSGRGREEEATEEGALQRSAAAGHRATMPVLLPFSGDQKSHGQSFCPCSMAPLVAA